MYILPYSIIIMFQTLANIERKISEMGKLRKAKKEAHKKNEADFKVRKDYINSSEFTEEKIVESDDVTETATEKIIAKTSEVVDYTYYTNDKKQHGIIAITAKKLGIGKLEFPRSKFGRLDYYLKFEGNTNQANKLMVENWDSFKNYIHRSERKNTKKVWSKQ